MRHRPVIARLRHPTRHPLALELLLRVGAIVLAAVVILGLLPAMVEAAA